MIRRILAAAAATVLAAAALAAPPASAAANLVVLNWNIRGESADIKAMAAVIRASGANIVTLQEIHRRPDADQVRQLAAELGWHISDNAHFGAGDNVGPCDDPQPGTAGNAVLSKYKIVERVTIRLTDYATCPVNRSMAGVRLDLGGGATIRVFTTHLSPGLSAESVARRQAQARKILDYFGTRTGLILTGDFNAKPTDTVTKWFVQAGWLDTGARHADEPTLGSARIDYVFTRGVTVTGGDVLSSNLSDHRPIVMRMTR